MGQLSPPQLDELETLLNQRHRRFLRANEHIKAQHHASDGVETLIYDVVDGAAVFRFEAETDVHADATELLMDFLDGVLTEWFKGRREAYPTIDFAPYEFEGTTIRLRGGRGRPDLEAAADALLGGLDE